MEKKRKEFLIEEINCVHPKKKSKNLSFFQSFQLDDNTRYLMWDEKGLKQTINKATMSDMKTSLESVSSEKMEDERMESVDLRQIDLGSTSQQKIESASHEKDVRIGKNVFQSSLEDVPFENDDEEMMESLFDECYALQSLLRIMRSDETVMCTIKRLGTSVISNRSKQMSKKREASNIGISVSSGIGKNPEELTKLKLQLEEITGIIDQFIRYGCDDIHQKTYEHLFNKLNQIQSSTWRLTNQRRTDIIP